MAVKTLGVTGILYTDRRDFYPSPQFLAELHPNATPFLSDLLEMVKGKTMQEMGRTDPTYKMFQYRAGYRKQYFLVNAAAPDAWSNPGAGVGTPGATVTVACDGAVGVGANDNTIDTSVLHQEVEIWDTTNTTYKGNAVVTALNGANITLTAVSNPASSTETMVALADNDILYVVGGAFGETGEAPEAAHDELQVAWNSCFIHRTSLELSETLLNTNLRGSANELSRLQTTRGIRHKYNLNMKLLRGAKRGGIGGGHATDTFNDTHITDADGDRVRGSMGLIPAFRRNGFASGDYQNVFVGNFNTVTYNDLIDWADKSYHYNPSGGIKTLYAGPGFVKWLHKIGAEGIATRINKARMPIEFKGNGSSSLGHSISRLVIGDVEWNVKKDESLRFTPYNNWAHSLDMEHVGIVRFMADAYHVDIKKDNKPLVRKDEFFSYMGLYLGIMEAHSQFRMSE